MHELKVTPRGFLECAIYLTCSVFGLQEPTAAIENMKNIIPGTYMQLCVIYILTPPKQDIKQQKI